MAEPPLRVLLVDDEAPARRRMRDLLDDCAAALPLAVLSLVFLIGSPASLHGVRLQVEHRWRRFQMLLMAGSLSGLAVSIVIAILGGGYWALVASSMAPGLAVAIDDLFVSRTSRHFVTSWSRHRGTFRFGMSRFAAASIISGRQMIEQATMVNAFNFATLGIFTRSLSLAMLASGRIGPLVVSSLYPAITRVEPGTPQFREVTGLVLRGIVWLTIPASIFLAMNARDIVQLLYGPRWSAVAGLLPIAAAQIGAVGVSSACYNLLLANQNIRACMIVDFVSGGLAILLALLVIPLGVSVYLAGLTLHAAATTALVLFLLWRNKAINVVDVGRAMFPPLLAGAVAAAAMTIADRAGLQGLHYGVALAARAVIFGVVVAGVLRFAMPGLLNELLATAPGGGHMRRVLGLA